MSVELEETQPATRDSGPALPHRISKYELGERLGTGGNGVVLLARDTTLDRKVAIKVLRGAATEEASQRLLREAQSAAKLSHENVIVVHEVGTQDGNVFVAMEYVAGGTLRDWARTHGWRDVLDAYRRAGRGLAAAHAAGLVHRDFKPDNVLVGDDGRVRVSDFGLVSVSGTRTESPPRALGGTALDTTLTRSGTIMGTPRYMAPEQHEGAAVDARADQFAFCVALYEGLYHRLPFEGETYEAIANHACAGEIVPPPADSPVPRAIRDAILRGLSPAPADRWPSMPALLDALTPAAPRSRRLWLAVVPAVLLLAAVAVFFSQRSRRAPPAESSDPVEVMKGAEAAYMRGDFAAAIAGFKRAYVLDPNLDKSPAYLYDIAQAYRQMGKCADAALAYRHYLQLKPDSKKKADIEAMIEQLDVCVARLGSAAR
ncbi:MAG TPA: protein kinase [Kofleriaceae bacterium]|nr:protein kinase [Kofleriaceae bacterium]